jgi:NAD(P)-dependent dehydrogenase (short-subunit alcohol dehydrogenase family)
MNPVYNFTGQVALVTGASSGIGLAAAKAFAEAGAAVVLADVNTDAVETATVELRSAEHRAIGITCDVADETQAAAMVEETVATYGRLDMAFNNAGVVGFIGDLAEESAAYRIPASSPIIRGSHPRAARGSVEVHHRPGWCERRSVDQVTGVHQV